MSEPPKRFNPPRGWPKPPEGWQPPAGWQPDPSWPAPPPGWTLWLPIAEEPAEAPEPAATSEHTGALPTPSAPQPTQSAPPTDSGQPELEALRAENHRLRTELASAQTDPDETVPLDDDKVLQEVGIYRYHHPLENAAAYKDRLSAISSAQADLVKARQAIHKSSTFTFDNSLAKGRKMTADLSKLMLRAYNAEADNSIRTLKAGNVVTAKKSLEASRTAIARLGKLMEMKISDEFHDLRLAEIELTADWLMKKQEEREAAREERARLREERRVEKELAEERARLDKERAHIENALAALQQSGEEDADLQTRLEALDEAITQNDFRAANIRAGYVYVISNRGAFGPGVVKIGLTRRLEPQDRIQELSGASVAFPFDVHALFFTEDAVTIEIELHRQFATRALNQVNSRKEFFFAEPEGVRVVLTEKVGNLLEFNEHAEATQYLQSSGNWPVQNFGASSHSARIRHLPK